MPNSSWSPSEMRDELLNETLFFSFDAARQHLAGWVTDYNHRRPRSALGYQTPAAYAARPTATDSRFRVMDALGQPPVAPSAHERQNEAPTPVSSGWSSGVTAEGDSLDQGAVAKPWRVGRMSGIGRADRGAGQPEGEGTLAIADQKSRIRGSQIRAPKNRKVTFMGAEPLR